MNCIRWSILPGILAVLLLCSAVSAQSTQSLPINEKNTERLNAILKDAEKEIAAQPDSLDAYKRAGVALHQLALFSGKGYAEKGIEYLGRVVKAEPDDAVMQAYYGSLHALHGRDGTVVMQRLSNVNKGVSILNRAVKKAPEDFIVRMVRASVFFELPPMFKQNDTAFEDFLFIENKLANMDAPDPDMQAEVYYKLGFLAGEKELAELKRTYFAKAIEISPKSQWAELARKD